MKEMLMAYKYYAVVVIFIAIAGIYYFQSEDKELSVNQELNLEKDMLASETKGGGTTKAVEDTPPQTMMADVKGAVQQPGVYLVKEGERVIDLISKAGGFTELADETKVNLAEHVQDAMVVYIPKKGEEGFAAPVSGGVSANPGGAGQKEGKVNINTADVNELQNLPGVGPSKADAIIEHRETNGLFQTPEDLKKVSGIGDKTFEKLQDLIVVQ